MRIEATVFVDHYHAGERAGGIGRARQIAPYLARGARERHLFGLQAWIVRGHDRRLGVVRLQRRQDRRGRGRAAGHLCQAVHEDSAIEPLVGVFVVQLDDFLTH
jgi:hypothetical protein